MSTKFPRKPRTLVTILFVMFVFVLAACGPKSADQDHVRAEAPVTANDERAANERGNSTQEGQSATDDDHHAGTGDHAADDAANPDSDETAEPSTDTMMDGDAAMGHDEGMAHMEGMGHEDMAAAHNVPDEYAQMANPIEATASSIARGTELFQATCAVCHGETGQGDGVGSAGLDPKPANLSDAHVQGNPDGALFYTITKGVPGTAMVAWESVISEEDRWHLVNFIRTVKPQ